MKRAILLISPMMLVDLLKAPGSPRTFEVTDYAIPADAKLVDVKYVNSRNEIALELESEAWNDIPEKGAAPVLPMPQTRSVDAVLQCFECGARALAEGRRVALIRLSESDTGCAAPSTL